MAAISGGGVRICSGEIREWHRGIMICHGGELRSIGTEEFHNAMSCYEW